MLRGQVPAAYLWLLRLRRVKALFKALYTYANRALYYESLNRCRPHTSGCSASAELRLYLRLSTLMLIEPYTTRALIGAGEGEDGAGNSIGSAGADVYSRCRDIKALLRLFKSLLRLY